MLRAHDEEGDLSPSLPRSRQLKTTLKTSSLDKRVALLQVHFEGNVGDQMETIPLLKRLHGTMLQPRFSTETHARCSL